MPAKKPKAARPVIDPDIAREAQARADTDHRGNLTAYINALIKADISRNSHSPAVKTVKKK